MFSRERSLPFETYRELNLIIFLRHDRFIFVIFFRLSIYRSCPIDFAWINYKPIMEDNLMGMTNLNESSYAPDPSSLFSIAPRQGTLDRDEEKTFEILFAPNKVTRVENLKRNLVIVLFILFKIRLVNFRLFRI